MTYRREVPRDLFNEASLLKCLGQLALIIHDRGIPREQLRVSHMGRGFGVDQDPADGSIYAASVQIVIREELFAHRRPLNSREPWPLYVVPAFDPDGAEVAVFEIDGQLSPEFRALMEGDPA